MATTATSSTAPGADRALAGPRPLRVFLLYLAAVAWVTVYGTEVCPFVDGMTSGELLGLAAVGLGSGLGLRVGGGRFMSGVPVFDRARRRFWIELMALVGAGSIAGLTTVLGWGFPLASAAKVLLGYGALGVFTALALALDEEHRTLSAAEAGSPRPLDGFTSIARRFLSIALSLAAMVAGILVLIILRDISWLATLEGAEWQRARTLVAAELVFVSVVVLGYVALLTTLFARNLRLFLALELETMQAVAQGRYDRRVPVGSRTELGHIAYHTNRMIDGLRERDHIRNIFGKMVSPAVSAELLDESGALLERAGRRQEAVVLFSDLRDFTRRTEEADPGALVRDLNLYFERMVEAIHGADGVVDKFIGDGIMAVFGLTDPASAPERAVRAARAMQGALDGMQDELSAPLRMGIGIHVGEVVAGAFGAPDRLEFTVLGDTVNTAARLEAATKALDVSILVSEAVHARLGPEAREPWRHLGQQSLKGKRDPVEVYGL